MKEGQEKKENLKCQSPDRHISPWNILPRKVAGTSCPLKDLARGWHAVRTPPRRVVAILRGRHGHI
jgi:hypothetical protein